MNTQWAGLVLLLSLANSALAEDRIASLDWQVLANNGGLINGVVESATKELRIESRLGQPYQRIVSMDAPGIGQPVYAIRGTVRYAGVEGDAYLQMDSIFGEQSYFSKTLAPTGPIGKITGDSAPRDFVLPFFITQGEQSASKIRPSRLELGVFLPGAGTLYLSNVSLFEYAAGEDLMAGLQLQDSLQHRRYGIISGIAGAAFGVLCALAGMLANAGRARNIVVPFVKLLPLVGAGSLCFGVFAYFDGQPYPVFYTYGLLGLLLLVVGLPLSRAIEKRYAERELRKMQAMDV